MSFDSIVVGDYGQVAKITFIDVDTDAAADISSYNSTQSMIFYDPTGTASTVTAAFDTDGSDGVIKYTIESGLFDVAGLWQVRGKVTSVQATLSTVRIGFTVHNG